ncbi:MAG: succinate dehydrogenase, hydrophobic membrane anchor protein [Sinobacteraceae bacterium]|jgi:succinate dehydrogenase / fumarate reductase membrane anchor subunit|nr:succinate dehydrogenase, hydrophobic membrane anchor protein [Nevskia sp.]MDI3258292.1 succinate dehydrogenase, hydrophobic membrane anchor protein [Nevskiaceae bacterium]
MKLRSPLSQARGLGSAKDGVGHWWLQRLTALALIPLSLWFVFSVARYRVADYATLVAWMHNPYAAIALALWLIALFWHSALGVQVVIEDYVANEALRFGGVILEKFAHFALGVGSVFAVLKLAFGVA